MREITIGQYYMADSPIHRLDPRVKLFATLGFMITLLFQKNFPAYVVAFLAFAVVVKLSTVPVGFLLRGLKPIAFIILFSIVVNMLFVPGEILVKFGIFQITKEGIVMAVGLSIRLALIILGASVMTLTTTPNELTDGLEKSFDFLNKIHVPVHEIAMMMSIALRFIPILTEETDRIMKAQMARGADLDSGNLIQKIKGLIPILVPLFVAAIRRAGDLAMAMEAKCYNGSEGRTKMKPLIYKKEDRTAYMFVVLYLAMMIGFAVFAPKLGFGF